MLKSSSWSYLGLFVAFLLTGNAVVSLVQDWQIVGLSLCLLAGMFTWKRFQARFQTPQPISRATLQQELKWVEQTIAKISDRTQRQQLLQQAEQIATSLQQNQFQIALFGKGSAGKTSVINTLLGKKAGLTAATIGTTKARAEYTYKSKENRCILLVDTPGTLEIGEGGRSRQALALEIAESSDLLIFVATADLTASEYQDLVKLSQLGKRIVLALNKTDQYSQVDRQVILAALTHSVAGMISGADIVSIAAQPSPIKVRQSSPDCTQPVQEWLEPLPPDVASLRTRIEQILSSELEQLLLKNTSQQIKALEQSAQAILKQIRRQLAEQLVIDRQWLTAATVFASPLPALDLFAGVAINTQLLIELSRLYDRSLSISQAKRTITILAQVLVKLGGVEVASAAIGSCLKTNAVTYAIGGSVQAISAAYLIHIGGMSYIDYLEQEPEIQASTDMIKTALSKFCQAKINQTNAQGSKFFKDFAQNFASSAINRISNRNSNSGELHISTFSS